MRIAIELSLIFVLLGINAVLAASEAAIISLRKTRPRIGVTLAGFFAAIGWSRSREAT